MLSLAALLDAQVKRLDIKQTASFRQSRWSLQFPFGAKPPER
jgi:hypothetical protein